MAKTEHYFTRFENNGIYHVYNRSIDRKPMFLSDRNYHFFIRQFDKYLSNYIKIYAYCLLGNHFHFLIKINDLTDLTTFEKLSNFKKSNESSTTHDIISNQFKKFFQSYAMAFNKENSRVGTLFQTPFKRVRVEEENYLRELTCYINTNAQKHSLVKDFRDWKWSSYHNLISEKETKLFKKEVLSYFDDVDNFTYSHIEYVKRMDSIERDFYIED
ncbi:hypothetical protein B6A10_04165 [Flavobacterium sp. L1I52]|uniref:Transposase IS200-like domain-containing protein n=1 Tax=Flavobacterium pokkalii TaxID=1940408 RepID=A0ABR7UQ80_9FLAO|nr:hypothetical protein [Flavobacterium pokkalii]KQB37982.1 putative transposase [Flavobacterium daejeonense]MBD0724368.1 hypothetical protein [Flavobacterium pokkalii]